MIGTIFLLCWFLLVAVGVAVAESKGHTKELHGNTFLSKQLRYKIEELRQADDRMAHFIASYRNRERDGLRNFDQVLASLPRDYRQCREPMWRVRGLTMDAMAINRNPNPHDMVFTTLDFDAVPFVMDGDRIMCWRRNGWLILNEVAVNRRFW